MQDNHDFKAEPNQDRLIESRTHCEALLGVEDCSADILPLSFGSYEHDRDHAFRDFGLVFSRKTSKFSAMASQNCRLKERISRGKRIIFVAEKGGKFGEIE